MNVRYNWKKGFLKNKMEIFSNGNQIGNFVDKTFSQSASGELSDKKYLFQTIGLFNQKTIVVDGSKNLNLGEITYNTIKTTAKIDFNGKVFFWKNENWRHSKWKFYNTDTSIAYRGSSFIGELESDTEDPLLILTGLYIANYYWQSVVAIMMVLFLIIVVIN